MFFSLLQEEDDSSDDEDDTAALLAELNKIKKERTREKAKMVGFPNNTITCIGLCI